MTKTKTTAALTTVATIVTSLAIRLGIMVVIATILTIMVIRAIMSTIRHLIYRSSQSDSDAQTGNDYH